MKRIIVFSMATVLLIFLANIGVGQDPIYVSGIINTASVSVSSSAVTTILSSNVKTREVILHNNSSYTIYIGSSGVTASCGYTLDTNMTVIIKTQATIYGLAEAGNPANIRVLQVR